MESFLFLIASSFVKKDPDCKKIFYSSKLGILSNFRHGKKWNAKRWNDWNKVDLMVKRRINTYLQMSPTLISSIFDSLCSWTSYLSQIVCRIISHVVWLWRNWGWQSRSWTNFQGRTKILKQIINIKLISNSGRVPRCAS